jgi:hypothetical protein
LEIRLVWTGRDLEDFMRHDRSGDALARAY